MRGRPEHESAVDRSAHVGAALRGRIVSTDQGRAATPPCRRRHVSDGNAGKRILHPLMPHDRGTLPAWHPSYCIAESGQGCLATHPATGKTRRADAFSVARRFPSSQRSASFVSAIVRGYRHVLFLIGARRLVGDRHRHQQTRGRRDRPTDVARSAFAVGTACGAGFGGVRMATACRGMVTAPCSAARSSSAVRQPYRSTRTPVSGMKMVLANPATTMMASTAWHAAAG
jgi:hypothetical protein